MLTLTGLALGLLAAAAFTRVLRTLLFGVTATDPLTFAAVALFFVVVATAATLAPARWASLSRSPHGPAKPMDAWRPSGGTFDSPRGCWPEARGSASLRWLRWRSASARTPRSSAWSTGCLLKPLPYSDPDRLVVVWEHNLPRDRKNNVVSPGNYLHWREMNTVVRGAGGRQHDVPHRVHRRRRARGTAAADRQCDALPDARSHAGARACLHARGRSAAGDRRCPHQRSAVAASLRPQSRGRQPPIHLDGTLYTVSSASCLPGFSILDKDVDVWVPRISAQARTPRGRWLMVVGRLKDGSHFGAGAGRHDARRRAAGADVSGVRHRLDGAVVPLRTADRRRPPGALRACSAPSGSSS